MSASSSPQHPEESSRGTGPQLDRRTFLAWTGAVGTAAGLSEASSRPVLAAGVTGKATLTAQQEASRFLAQCTFGGDLNLINQVVAEGFESWLDDQMALSYQPMLTEVLAYLEADPEFDDFFVYCDWIWWQRAMTSTDLVRHRVAFALSQIFVISRQIDELFDSSPGIASYHDVLARGAFGNFRDMLLEITLHPCMGIYLSHLHNRRSDPSVNRFPDENFAREVMQLFTIGLFELNPDGTRKLDGQGQPIPTYTNAQITEFAKIFTGLTYAPEEPDEPILFGQEGFTFDLPMVMYEPEHEPGPKTLLNGFVVPGGQTGMQDIEAAIDHLFQHPNVGPFIGQHLIRFLVTSNPSPAYVARVAAAFDDNGAGVRGDMKAVLRAVLLDTEARDTSRIDDPQFGKVREPFVRWVQLGRAFHATSNSGLFRHFGGSVPGDDGETINENSSMAQYPFFAPSVFNFFSPVHQPAGPLATANLVAPEMEIIHAFTSIATINLINRAIVEEEYLEDNWEEVIHLDLSDLIALAETDPNALVDHLDLLLTYGTLSAGTRQIMLDAILPFADEAYNQVELALYLFMICPEYAVQR